MYDRVTTEEVLLRVKHIGRCAALLRGMVPLLAALVGGCSEALSQSCVAPPEGAAASARVVTVIDGDTVVLSSGEEVRLVGIQAPKLPLGRAGFEAWPLAPEARDALEEMAGGRHAVLWSSGAAGDRHGRVLAHVYVEDGEGRFVWLQGALLANGLARVYTFADNRACASDMLAAEARARAAGLGMWGLASYRILDAGDADRLKRLSGTFQIVEGRVRQVAEVRGRGYLNFDDDWREDFTVTVAPGDLKLFANDGAGLSAYEGRRVRARGWLRSFNGPLIEATHPEQIEVLE